MTYDPYEEEEEVRQDVKDLMEEVNLPDGWTEDLKAAMLTLRRRDPKEANRLLKKIEELTAAYAKRGRLIENLVEANRRLTGRAPRK